jgi:hypothetical protein
VLEAWTASPARFREDANAEEELVRGGYRDRLVVELAQNAADAAARAGAPGRLSLRLETGAEGPATLIAANTGAPLDAAGVGSLSTLRASTKRTGPTVGRFGVGFAAVLAVSEAPQVHSTTGAVGWSTEFTRDAIAAVPELAAEADRRRGAVPVLRLPFEVAGQPPDGYDTAVVLPLRDAAALDLVTRLLAEVDDALLLALAGLDAIEIVTPDSRRELSAQRSGAWVTVRAGARVTRWRTVHRSGELPAEVVAERPVEERADWQLTWALPIEDDRPAPLPDTVRAVLHAPTPTDERLDLPALLLGSFPVDSSRRRVAPGRATDLLLDAAAEAYADLVAALAGAVGPAAAALIPGPVGVGEIDAQLRRTILEKLADRSFLPAADGGLPLRPRDAVLVADCGAELTEVLSPVLGGLLPPGWPSSALTRLGARRLSLAEVVDELAGIDRPPAWWRSCYSAVDGGDREALRGLPVPLADGRLVRDPREVLLPGDVDAQTLSALGLRVAHPEAVHPLLERLGARPATAEAVVDHPAVRGLVAGLIDGYPEEQQAVAEALLTLVGAAPWATRPWLAELPLPDLDGELTPAGELLLPGGALVDVLEPDALGVVDEKLLERFGPDALRAVGVLDSFAVVQDTDLPADPECADHDLDGEEEWLAAVAAAAGSGGPAIVVVFSAVRDLDLVAADRWPAALALLSGPDLRSLVTEPARVRRADGRGAELPSYTAWWLGEHPVLAGRRPRDLRAPDADLVLHGLWDEAPPGLDLFFARALGVRTGLAELLDRPDGPSELLARLADPGRHVGRKQLGVLYRALAAVAPERVPEQDYLRVPDGPRTRVVPADDVVVVDAPDLLALCADVALPVAVELAADLAEVLLLPLASERTPAPVLDAGEPVPVPVTVRDLLGPRCPAEYVEHETLRVAGPDGPVEVDWRWVGGHLHAATTRGLAFGLAWAAGAWERRWLVCAALEDPEQLPAALDEEDLTPRV